MIHQRGSHPYVHILHHLAASAELVGVNERFQRHAPFVCDARVDFLCVHFEEQLERVAIDA
jgi:hypothetical protein